jgi:hypothetical protein
MKKILVIDKNNYMFFLNNLALIENKEIYLEYSFNSKILEKFLVAKKIYISESMYKRLPKKIKDKVEIIRVKRGKRPNINLNILKKIYELKKMGVSIRKISKILKIPKSTVHYYLGYLRNFKIKDGPYRYLIL